jgi:hypothetical protein
MVAISVSAADEMMGSIGKIKQIIAELRIIPSDETPLAIWDKAKSQAYFVQIDADRADRCIESIANSLVHVWMGRVSLLRAEALTRMRALCATDQNGTNSMTHLLSLNPIDPDATTSTTHLVAVNSTTDMDAELEKWSKIQRIALNATRAWMTAKKKIERMYTAILDLWAQYKTEAEMNLEIDWPEFEKETTAMKIEKVVARVTKAEQKLRLAVVGLQSVRTEIDRYVSEHGYWYLVRR